MLSNPLLFSLFFAAAFALPGPRNVQHHHHAKRDDVVVYATVQVTEYVTMTAGQSAVNQAGNVAIASTSSSVTTLSTITTSASASTSVPATSTASPVAKSSSTSTTAAAAASTTASATTASASSGTKRGLAWASSNPTSMESLFSSSVLSWYFNWGTGATSGIAKTFIYEQWGSDNMDNVNSLPTGSTLIGFNEPDGTGQATMTAAQAAAYYKANFTPLRQTGQIAYLGTPSITNGANGIVWLTAFMEACSDCEIDFVSAHWYGPTLALLESQMTAIHTAFGLPIWLTEIACTNWDASSNPSASDISTFMTASIAWLESTSWIAKYAWFGALVITDTALGTANSLVTSDGSALSSLGQQYLSL